MKCGTRARRKSGCGQEVGVEDRDELALGDLQTVRRARRPCSPCDRRGGCRRCRAAFARSASTLLRTRRSRLVGRVVEHLDLEAAARVVDRRRRARGGERRPSPRCRAAAAWSRGEGRGAPRSPRRAGPARPPSVPSGGAGGAGRSGRGGCGGARTSRGQGARQSTPCRARSASDRVSRKQPGQLYALVFHCIGPVPFEGSRSSPRAPHPGASVPSVPFEGSRSSPRAPHPGASVPSVPFEGSRSSPRAPHPGVRGRHGLGQTADNAF